MPAFYFNYANEELVLLRLKYERKGVFVTIWESYVNMECVVQSK